MILPLLLLERQHSVILTDVDAYWVRDPTSYLEALAADKGVELAMMQGFCNNAFNSGFMYYRAGPDPAKGVRGMLRTALGMKKWRNQGGHMDTDNDQFVLNCAWTHMALHEDLNYWILPRHSFTFGSLGFVNFKC